MGEVLDFHVEVAKDVDENSSMGPLHISGVRATSELQLNAVCAWVQWGC